MVERTYMGKFIDITELREFCKQQNLEDEVRSSSSLDKAKEIIKGKLPHGILASKPSIKE